MDEIRAMEEQLAERKQREKEKKMLEMDGLKAQVKQLDDQMAPLASQRKDLMRQIQVKKNEIDLLDCGSSSSNSSKTSQAAKIKKPSKKEMIDGTGLEIKNEPLEIKNEPGEFPKAAVEQVGDKIRCARCHFYKKGKKGDYNFERHVDKDKPCEKWSIQTILAKRSHNAKGLGDFEGGLEENEEKMRKNETKRKMEPNNFEEGEVELKKMKTEIGETEVVEFGENGFEDGQKMKLRSGSRRSNPRQKALAKLQQERKDKEMLKEFYKEGWKLNKDEMRVEYEKLKKQVEASKDGGKELAKKGEIVDPTNEGKIDEEKKEQNEEEVEEIVNETIFKEEEGPKNGEENEDEKRKIEEANAELNLNKDGEEGKGEGIVKMKNEENVDEVLGDEKKEGDEKKVITVKIEKEEKIEEEEKVEMDTAMEPIFIVGENVDEKMDAKKEEPTLINGVDEENGKGKIDGKENEEIGQKEEFLGSKVIKEEEGDEIEGNGFAF